MKYHILLSLLIYSFALTSQCDSLIVLETQTQVDNFNFDHPDCNTIYELWIEVKCENDQIRNLDSLYQIFETTNLFIIGECSPKSIKGLDNLIQIKNLDIVTLDSLNHQLSFNNLRKIENLHINFRESSSNLEFLNQVDTITSIATYRTGQFKGLNDNAKKSIEAIGLQDFERDLKLSEITSNKNLISFGVLRSKNILIDSLFESIDRISINQTETKEEILFENNNIKINNLRLNNVKVVSPFVFNKVDTLGGLWISNVDQLENLDSVFPNLISIENSLNLHKNVNFEIINFNSVEIPHGKKVAGYPDFVRIILANNPNLNSCESNFLCRGYRTYPDSMMISENGMMCKPESILLYCLTGSNTEKISKINIYPNPASNKLYFNTDTHESRLFVRIIDQLGRRCLITALQKEINIENFPNGLYMVQIIDEQNKILQIEKVMIVK